MKFNFTFKIGFQILASCTARMVALPAGARPAGGRRVRPPPPARCWLRGKAGRAGPVRPGGVKINCLRSLFGTIDFMQQSIVSGACLSPPPAARILTFPDSGANKHALSVSLSRSSSGWAGGDTRSVNNFPAFFECELSAIQRKP